MTALEEIKKALAEATLYPGPWEVGELIKRRPYSDAWELQNATDLFGYIYCGHEEPEDVKHVVEYIAAVNPAAISELLSTLESLQRENEDLREENGSLLDENCDLRNEPWPEWAKAVLKVIRSHTGYDGYDDAIEGVDMPLELEEHLSELQSFNERLQSRAEAAEAEVKRLQAEIDRKSSMPGDHRYWEGRYRDEAAENDRLREALQKVAETEPSGHLDFHKPKHSGYAAFEIARTALASTGGEHHE